MEVVVNKKALMAALLESLIEEEEYEPEFERISMSDDPIVPSEMMSTQLAEEMPPVGDPEFIPVSIEELRRSAYVIANEVPESQIEYFYRRLHSLLDDALDRESAASLQAESFKSLISNLLRENDADVEITVEDVESFSSYRSATDKDEYLLGYNAGVDDDAGIEVEMPDSPTNDFMLGYEEGLRQGSLNEEPAEAISQDIVDDILRKNLHTSPLRDPETGKPNMVPVVIIDPKTGDFKMSEKEMTVLSSEKAAEDIIATALGHSEINDKYEKLKARFKTEESAMLMLYSSLVNVLGKDPGRGNIADSQTSAEIYANQVADALGKYGQNVADALVDISQNLEDQTEEISVEIGKSTKRKSKEGDVSSDETVDDEVLRLTVDPQVFKQVLLDVAEQRREAPRRGRKASGYEEIRLSPEERKAIRDTMKREMLDKIMQSGDNRDMIYLDQQMISTLQKLTAEETGQKEGTVRNVFYDVMYDLGLPPETMRKMAGVEKMPRGREAIPLYIDPLRLQAETEIVEKVYEIYRDNLAEYLDSIIEDAGDDQAGKNAQEMKNLFLGPGGYYGPGLDGYLTLQRQTGGPYMSDKDSVDIDSSSWKAKRRAYDMFQVFIDEIAKDYVGEDSDAYSSAKGGGIRALLNQMKEDEMFDTLEARGNFDSLIDEALSELDFYSKDNLESQEWDKVIAPMIDKSFDKSKGRVASYIKRIKKELG